MNDTTRLHAAAFKAPFMVATQNTETTKFVYNAAGEQVAKLTAPDDNREGIEFLEDHAELFRKAPEMAAALTEIIGVTFQATTDREKYHQIREICSRFVTL